MKIETLNEFVVLADCKNYSKAADSLFIAQSTLTKHIQQLEKELGVELINHRQYAFSLTLDGIMFYDYARKIVTLRQNYMARLASPGMDETGLNYGTGYLSSDEHEILIDAIENFSAIYSRCTVNTTRFMHFSHCRSLLQNGDISLAIVKYNSDSHVAFTNKPQSEFELIPLYQIPMVAILPEDYPLSGDTLSLTDLAGEAFILGARNTFRFHNCYSTCLSEGFEPRIAHTFDKPETILSFVERGKGVSIAPAILAVKFPDRKLRFVRFEPQLVEKTAIICPKNASPYSTEKQFVNCVLEAFRKSGYVESWRQWQGP